MVCDEAVAVERVRPLLADAVAGNDRCEVGRSVTNHGALPVQTRVIGWILRFCADGRRVKDQFGAFEGHDAGSFGEPLVPANGNADAHFLGKMRDGDIPNRESRIARSKVELLLVAWAVWNVTFAVQTEQRAVAVDNDEGIEEGVAAALK